MTAYFPFDPNTRKPVKPPPPGSCDCQFHVFGPKEKYPVRPGAAYEMPTATIAEALKMHRALGIERGVIVHSTAYGTDNRLLLEGLATAGPGYRGCAVSGILENGSDAEVLSLHEAGVRAVRFNFLKEVNLMPSMQLFHRLIDRLAELKWHARIQPSRHGIREDVQLLKNVRIPVVIDHFGRPTPGDTESGSNVATVVELLKQGNFWVMLSNGYRYAKTGFPWNDIIPVARAYIEAAPDRVIWGSDWPHPLSTTQPPNDADLLELMYRYVTSEAEMKRILVDNPAALHGF